MDGNACKMNSRVGAGVYRSSYRFSVALGSSSLIFQADNIIYTIAPERYLKEDTEVLKSL